jgi:transposase
LWRSYLTITKDVTRVMNRIKALFRSWAIPCSGMTVYAPRHRAEWLSKITEPGVRVRAERLYQQLDLLQPVRLEARRELLAESHKHAAVQLLRQVPSIGPIRSALLVALLQTPHRFRTKRQLWAYSGFAVETHDSGEYRSVRGKLQPNRERITVRGLSYKFLVPVIVPKARSDALIKHSCMTPPKGICLWTSLRPAYPHPEVSYISIPPVTTVAEGMGAQSLDTLTVMA